MPLKLSTSSDIDLNYQTCAGLFNIIIRTRAGGLRKRPADIANNADQAVDPAQLELTSEISECT